MNKMVLPKITDLERFPDSAKHTTELLRLVNQPPPRKWIKTNPFANDSKYIPIETVEYLLTSIFLEWWVEVKEVKQIANSVVVCVRLFYRNPDGTTKWQDGIGAAPLQTKKGCGAVDWDNIQLSAVQMAAPAAESYAIKDAAEKIGKLFGKDLNRKDEMMYTNLDSRVYGLTQEQINSIKDAKTLEELARNWSALPAESKNALEELKNSTKQSLTTQQ